MRTSPRKLLAVMLAGGMLLVAFVALAEPPHDSHAGIVEDILSIRAAQHDGNHDPADEAEFAAALRDLIAAEKKPAEEPVEASLPVRTKDAAIVHHLRQSARHFDRLAADHEDAGDYLAADKAREMARALWEEARGLASP